MKHIKFLMAALAVIFCIQTLTTTLPPSCERQDKERWTLLTDDVITTVYHAVPAQCNADCLHTASMMTVHPDKLEKQRILAMERTMMKQYGIHYGDIVKIEGTGQYDGVWQVQDTMNKRFAGQHKIDLLIPVGAKMGKWTNVTIYKAADRNTTEKYSKQMNIS